VIRGARSSWLSQWQVRVAIGCLTLAVSGCGSAAPEMARVSGKVTIRGKPLTTGTITFVSTDNVRPNASSKIGTDGTFNLRTTLGEGAQPGEYRVVITDVNAGEVLDSAPKAPGKSKAAISSRYANPDTSNLNAVVKAGSNALSFDLK
jgi:hypothetical protein